MPQKHNPKPGLHPRNPMRLGYDFKQLIKIQPALNAFICLNPRGQQTIPFANPEAVRLLNAALLAQHYGIQDWDIPPGYLCPPIPGRADYIHYLADLLAESHQHQIPQGKTVRGLDIGTGANAIYPLIGFGEYGWHFVGTDIDKQALKSVEKITQANPQWGACFEARHQAQRESIFHGVIQAGDVFDFALCNPPFYTSKKQAAQANQRKNRHLGQGGKTRNFGGQNHELWCPGGELQFIQTMIRESADYATQCLWFSSLVSDKKHLPTLQKQLNRQQVTQQRIIPMAQGQKVSRILAWTFTLPKGPS